MSAEPDESRLSELLAWASLALGVAMTAAPQAANRLAGIRDDETTRRWQRIVGGRELAAFALIKVARVPGAVPFWGRAVGDAKDLALLALAARAKRAGGTRLGLAAAGVAAIAAADLYTAFRLGRQAQGGTEEEPLVDGRKPPPDDLEADPAYEPPPPMRGIKGG